MSEKESIHDDSVRSLEETDDLKSESAKARTETEFDNREMSQNLIDNIEKIKSKTLKGTRYQDGDGANTLKISEELQRLKELQELQNLQNLQELELKRKKYNLQQAKRMYLLTRLSQIAMFAPLTLGLLMLLLPLKSFYILFSINESYANTVAVSLILVSMFGLMLRYLQTGFKKNSDNKPDYTAEPLMESSHIKYTSENGTKEISNTLRLISSYRREAEGEIAKLREEVKTLKYEHYNKPSDSEILSAENKNEIVDSLKAKLLNETSQLTALEILNNINEKVSKNDKSGQIDNVFNQTLERLKSETASLGRRGNLNLSLGIVTTIIGLSLLGFFVVETKIIPEDKLTFITSFIPRLSLVILIEVFAYFFLRLYKSTLSEIKYFQNEMTNIEAKYAAIQCAKFTDDKVAFSNAIAALTSTERNALLEKGQTTADIEMAKIENKNISVISEKVMKFIKNKNDEQ